MITKRIINFLKLYWKIGKIRSYNIPEDLLPKLLRLRLIKYSKKDRYYLLDRGMYLKSFKFTQKQLNEMEVKK